MIYFDSITIEKSSRLENLPWTIDNLKDLNVLIGSNGCGETTILGAMTEYSKDDFDKKYHSTVSYVRNPNHKPGVEFYTLFYKELVSPKPDFGLYDTSAFGIYDVMNSFKSAGERSFTQIDDIKNIKDSIVFIDEMDASLDWEHQIKFFRKIKRLSKSNQIFIATHSMIFCSLAKDLYDVKSRRWTTYEEIKTTYLKDIKL